MVLQGWCKLTPNARLNRWRRFPVSRKAAKTDAQQLWWQLRHCWRPGPGRRRKRFQQKRNILQRHAGPSNHGSRSLQHQRSGRPWWAQLLYVARLSTSSPCLRRVPFHPSSLSLQQLSLQQGITRNPNTFSTFPLLMCTWVEIKAKKFIAVKFSWRFFCYEPLPFPFLLAPRIALTTRYKTSSLLHLLMCRPTDQSWKTHSC